MKKLKTVPGVVYVERFDGSSWFPARLAVGGDDFVPGAVQLNTDDEKIEMRLSPEQAMQLIAALQTALVRR